jgi:hypothetical protein
VELDHAGASGALMKPIDVLGDQSQSGNQLLEPGQRVMAGIGNRVADLMTPDPIPLPDQLRIAPKRARGGQVLGPEVLP